MIDKCIGEKAHYKNLLNSVETSTCKSKEFVKQELTTITDPSIVASPVDILTLLKTPRIEQHVE